MVTSSLLFLTDVLIVPVLTALDDSYKNNFHYIILKVKITYMKTSRKKALKKKKKSIVAYKLIYEGWNVAYQIGDGYDLMAEKDSRLIKIELKAIDLAAIANGHNATQYLSANEIVSATHLIIMIFNGIELDGIYVMTMQQFVEICGVKKYDAYQNYEEFLKDYKRKAENKSERKKGAAKTSRLNFDFSFNPKCVEKWKLAKFKNQWNNLALMPETVMAA